MVVLMRYLLGTFALVTFAGLTGADAPVQNTAADEVQIVEITAERFSFTPSEVRTKAGTRLEIRLKSEDTAHGFHIVGSDVDIELPKRGRGIVTVSFVPKAVGRYTFECSQLCGAGHEFMRGVIIAE
jgi:cytochrome c oxidase subunit 2